MVNTAQSHRQLGGNKLLGKFQTIASPPSLSLLAKAFPSRFKGDVKSPVIVQNDLATPIEPKMSVFNSMRQSLNSTSLKNSQDSVSSSSPINVPISQPLTQLDALNVLDQVISEVENVIEPTPVLDGSLVQALPQATRQAAAGQPYAASRSLAKESAIATSGPDQIVGDIVGGTGPIEVELAKEVEIPVEVESYLQRVEDHKDQLPQEIVVADDGAAISSRPYPKQPVIVLPITPDLEKDGATKSPTLSIRWLVEWSHKIMKMFEGMVIYRQDITN